MSNMIDADVHSQPQSIYDIQDEIIDLEKRLQSAKARLSSGLNDDDIFPSEGNCGIPPSYLLAFSDCDFKVL